MEETRNRYNISDWKIPWEETTLERQWHRRKDIIENDVKETSCRWVN
jgi:hypothetical protein